MAGTLHEDRCAVLIMSRAVVLKMRNISGKSLRGNQNTHFVLKNLPPPLENQAVYDIMWKKYSRAKQAIDDSTAHAHRMLDT